MAPPYGPPNTPAYVEERREFQAKLQAYHQKRGTNFDPEPRVGARAIDLLHLWNTIIGAGGYDKVSDEKLLWRKIGDKFNAGQNHLPALAFQLKTVYYRFLAAYEISTLYEKEPPPREILEDTTARGGNLLTRTLENYRPAPSKGTDNSGEKADAEDASGEDGTPARDKAGSEEAPGSGGRVARGLRHAPPQRVLFQPEIQSSRQSRQVSATSHPPMPQQHQQAQHQHQPQQQQNTQHITPRGASSSYNPNHSTENLSMSVSNYEPRTQMPLTLRPVITPGNNPAEFARRQRIIAAAAAANDGKPVSNGPKVMLPGTGFDGPNIYVRCLCALKSGIPSEQDYALHHLVKISMERGDKYRFESFAGLAEALIDKVLEVGSLFYNVDWEVTYMQDGIHRGAGALDGLRGTPDILKKIASLIALPVDDNIHSEEFSDALLQINEAALTIRNMVMLEENAAYISEICPLHDCLCIALNLPEIDSLVELKHYALEIAEQLTRYMSFNRTDPLYISLLAQLQSEDRGVILTSLRAMTRISMNLEETNRLTGVPVQGMQNIINWLVLNDEDMVHACLDFLYQYTAVVENVDFLISNIPLEPLINQLTRLLTYNSKMVEKDFPIERETRDPAPERLADAPEELIEDLFRMAEPQRSSLWLKCMFEEDREESITQIALWQSYQTQFTHSDDPNSQSILPAAEFIKNVSTTFIDKASAQVQSGPVPKFIIKGIRYRATPISIHGEEYASCLWRQTDGTPCGQFYMDPERMHTHILNDHVGALPNEDGTYANAEGTYYCHWTTCRRFHSHPALKLIRIAQHLRVHLPKPAFDAKPPSFDTAPGSATYQAPQPQSMLNQPPTKKQKVLSYITAAKRMTLRSQLTATDERGDAAGIPLSAVLVLRNLARQIPKTEADAASVKGAAAGVSTTAVGWVDRLFLPVERHLFEIMAHNKSLTVYLTDLLNAIKDGS